MSEDALAATFPPVQGPFLIPRAAGAPAETTRLEPRLPPEFWQGNVPWMRPVFWKSPRRAAEKVRTEHGLGAQKTRLIPLSTG